MRIMINTIIILSIMKTIKGQTEPRIYIIKIRFYIFLGVLCFTTTYLTWNCFHQPYMLLLFFKKYNNIRYCSIAFTYEIFMFIFLFLAYTFYLMNLNYLQNNCQSKLFLTGWRKSFARIIPHRSPLYSILVCKTSSIHEGTWLGGGYPMYLNICYLCVPRRGMELN